MAWRWTDEAGKRCGAASPLTASSWFWLWWNADSSVDPSPCTTGGLVDQDEDASEAEGECPGGCSSMPDDSRSHSLSVVDRLPKLKLLDSDEPRLKRRSSWVCEAAGRGAAAEAALLLLDRQNQGIWGWVMDVEETWGKILKFLSSQGQLLLFRAISQKSLLFFVSFTCVTWAMLDRRVLLQSNPGSRH